MIVNRCASTRRGSDASSSGTVQGALRAATSARTRATSRLEDEEEAGDAELQMQLRLIAGAGVDFSLQRVSRLAQAAQLRATLSQAIAQLLHSARVAIFVFDQQRF